MAVIINGTTGFDFPAPLLVSEGGTGLESSGTSGNVLTSNGVVWTSSALPAAEVTASSSNTLTNKTINFADNSVNMTLARLNTAVADADVVSIDGSETLTNKTLTTPVLTNPTITNYVESVVSIGTVNSAHTLSLTDGTAQTATLTASTACTFTMPTAVAGKSFVLLLKQAASTGSGTATFTNVKWNSLGAPTITAAAGKMDILTFVSDGTNWYGSYSQGYTP